MDRLGPYILIFLFLGLTFFERARTKGETGSLWLVLARNAAVALICAVAFLLIRDFAAATSLFSGPEPDWKGVLLPALFSSVAGLIVAAGIWELKLYLWLRWLAVLIFSALIYPLFSDFETAHILSDRSDFYDFAGALPVWSLPAAFVLGFRFCVADRALPEERKHSLKGIKILPGMKHRFLVSRGIGFTMVFLVLNATTLTGLSWVLSKTLTLISASFTILFCNLFFFGLFGKNDMDRMSYAPPLLAVMAALTATQACNAYESHQAILAAVMTTFLTMLYLRTIPLKVRYWDPVCSTPVFLIGGICGIALASITDKAQLLPQLLGVVACLVAGIGSGAALALVLRPVSVRAE